MREGAAAASFSRSQQAAGTGTPLQEDSISIHPRIILLGLAIVGRPAALPAQASPTPQLLAASVLPLPEALRAGAGVRRISPAGVSILRPSTNGLMCTADRAGDAVFDVRCYQVEFLAVMDYVRAQRQQGMPDSTLDARLREAERQGLIRFPASPTAGYRMLGPIGGFDSVTVTTTAAIDRWQSVHFPFRTAAELGLPTEREGTMPFVMSSGTWWSHVMIVHTAAALP